MPPVFPCQPQDEFFWRLGHLGHCTLRAGTKRLETHSSTGNTSYLPRGPSLAVKPPISRLKEHFQEGVGVELPLECQLRLVQNRLNSSAFFTSPVARVKFMPRGRWRGRKPKKTWHKLQSQVVGCWSGPPITYSLHGKTGGMGDLWADPSTRAAFEPISSRLWLRSGLSNQAY